MRTADVMNAVKALIQADLARDTNSRIKFFLSSDVKGGWEAWLQVEVALAINAAIPTAAMRYKVIREPKYPGSNSRCDLQFLPSDSSKAGGGVPIWIEFKTQRAEGYTETISDFASDIVKLALLPQTDIIVGVAVIMDSPDAWTALKQVQVKSGYEIQPFRYKACSGAATLTNPSEVNVNDLLLLIFKIKA